MAKRLSKPSQRLSIVKASLSSLSGYPETRMTDILLRLGVWRAIATAGKSNLVIPAPLVTDGLADSLALWGVQGTEPTTCADSRVTNRTTVFVGTHHVCNRKGFLTGIRCIPKRGRICSA